MKKSNRLMAMLLSAATLVPLAACENESGATKTLDLGLWSKESYVKVLADIDYEEDFRGKFAFEVTACKNEYEGAQIVMTANGADISEYDFSVSDLVSADGEVFSKDNITVYNQKYVHVTSASANNSTGLGWYPDALLPFETAVEYGENKVEEGRNQSVYIEAYIPTDTKAGVYAGEFTLTVDGEKHAVPAKITVYDYTVSAQTHLKSNFSIQPDRIVVGEKAMNWELWNAYTDALVEYRTATTALAPSVLGGTLQDRIRRIRELCNPEMSKHNSLMGFIGVPTTRDGNIIKESEMQEFLVALTAASIVDGIDYLALADTRSGFIDEPHLNGTHDRVNTVITSFNGVRDGFADSLLNGAVKEAVKADVASVVGVTMDEAEFESRYEEMKETLAASTLEISNTVTSLVDSRLTAVDTYCVTRKGSTNAKDREYYKDLEADQWWYNCGSDKVGYRIDGDLLECRILGWMSYDYEYEGDVYWDAALYTKQTWSAIGRVNIETAVDTYTEPVHCGGNNGDGFLFYPGKPYGIEGPVSSVRIHSIRDGREDYELFYDLEQRYEAQGYSPRAVLTKIFDGLYQDLDLIDNPSSVFAAARETVIDMLLLADKGVYITDYEEVGATAKTRIERLGETTIGKINGQTQANKTVYEVQTALTGANNALSIECSDGTAFTMALGGKTETLQTFTKTTQMTGDNVALAIGEADGVQGVSVTLLETAQAYDLNVVEIPLAASDITKNDTSFTVRIYNPDTRKAYVSAYMSGSGGVAYAGDCVLYHGWNSFKVKRLNGILWDNVKKLQSLRLEFSLRDGESVAEQQPLLIASLAVER